MINPWTYYEQFLINMSSVSTSDDVADLFVFILVVIPDQDWMSDEVPNPVWLGVCSEVELL